MSPKSAIASSMADLGMFSNISSPISTTARRTFTLLSVGFLTLRAVFLADALGLAGVRPPAKLGGPDEGAIPRCEVL